MAVRGARGLRKKDEEWWPFFLPTMTRFSAQEQVPSEILAARFAMSREEKKEDERQASFREKGAAYSPVPSRESWPGSPLFRTCQRVGSFLYCYDWRHMSDIED